MGFYLAEKMARLDDFLSATLKASVVWTISQTGLWCLWDTRIVVETPGAGGYGPPAGRTSAALKIDYKSGKYSADFIDKHYKNTPKGG